MNTKNITLRVLLIILVVVCEIRYKWPEGVGTEKARKKLIVDLRNEVGGYRN